MAISFWVINLHIQLDKNHMFILPLKIRYENCFETITEGYCTYNTVYYFDQTIQD